MVLYRITGLNINDIGNDGPAVRFVNLDLANKDYTMSLSIIGSTRAIAQISQMAHDYVIQAIELLSHVPESRYRTLLEQFAKFVLARRH